jgi:nitric oxide reductase large subunit
MDTLRWMRVIGDTIFAAGTVALALGLVRRLGLEDRLVVIPNS